MLGLNAWASLIGARMVFIAIVAMLALFSRPACARQQTGDVSHALPEERITQIDSLVLRIQEQLDVPGFGVAIVRGDEVVYEKAFGFMNRSKGLPATPETLFYIGSITKTFTATLALILRDEGLIDLDDPVSKYLPAEVVVPSDPASQTEITLRHLMTHTSGLPRSHPNRKNMNVDGPIDAGVALPYDVEDLYTGLAMSELQSPVGERWSYSNQGFDLLGHALERATGASYEALLKKYIFEPLGMDDSTITLGEEDLERLAAFYWEADPERTERPRKVWGETQGAGAITSSVHDMAKYAAFQLKTEDRERDPLSLAGLQEMRVPNVAFDLFQGRPQRPKEFVGLEFHMGLGWWTVRHTETGNTEYWHGGEVDGHSSILIYSTEKHFTVVVLANLGGGRAVLSLARSLTALFD